MKKILLLFIMIFAFNSCEREENITQPNGTYSEEIPIKGRTQINFKSANELIIVKSNNSDGFNYIIEGNYIKLSNNQGYSQNFEYVQINQNEFKIENLYPNVPENSKSYMNFRK
jgi:hypothetical protein